MANMHQSQVEQRVRELDSAYDEALNTDPAVRSAGAALENAQRALNLSPGNFERRRHVAEAEKAYLAATNTFYHNARMARIEADKAAKRAVVEQAEAARAARLESEYKESLRPGYLAAGGTDALLEQEFYRPGGLWAQEVERRRAAVQNDMTQRRAFRSEATAHASAAPAAPAVEMVMVEAGESPAPNLIPPSRARGRRSPVAAEEAITSAHIE